MDHKMTNKIRAAPTDTRILVLRDHLVTIRSVTGKLCHMSKGAGPRKKQGQKKASQ